MANAVATYDMHLRVCTQLLADSCCSSSARGLLPRSPGAALPHLHQLQQPVLALLITSMVLEQAA